MLLFDVVKFVFLLIMTSFIPLETETKVREITIAFVTCSSNIINLNDTKVSHVPSLYLDIILNPITITTTNYYVLSYVRVCVYVCAITENNFILKPKVYNFHL